MRRFQVVRQGGLLPVLLFADVTLKSLLLLVDQLVTPKTRLPHKSLPALPTSEGLLICVRDPHVEHHQFLGIDVLATWKRT